MALSNMNLPAALADWSKPLEEEIEQRLQLIEPISLASAIQAACQGG